MCDDPELVEPQFACPNCGERDMDNLVWIEDDRVACQSCYYEYDPAGSNEEAPPHDQ